MLDKSLRYKWFSVHGFGARWKTLNVGQMQYPEQGITLFIPLGIQQEQTYKQSVLVISFVFTHTE